MRILFRGQVGFGQTSQMRMRVFEQLGPTFRGAGTIEARGASWLEQRAEVCAVRVGGG
jgi:hypothetical protein